MFPKFDRKKYEQDLPDEGYFNWKTVQLVVPEIPYYHNKTIIGVLARDGTFLCHGMHVLEHQFIVVDHNPLKLDEDSDFRTYVFNYRLEPAYDDNGETWYFGVLRPNEKWVKGVGFNLHQARQDAQEAIKTIIFKNKDGLYQPDQVFSVSPQGVRHTPTTIN